MAYTDAVKNAAVDATTVLQNSGKVRIYDGTPPLTPATALSGNDILVEFDMPATAFSAAVSGVATANAIATATGTAAAGAGTNATFYRAFNTDGTTVHSQGTVTATGGGGDMEIDNINIAENQQVNITSYTRSFT
jgi:hypothetical protein